MKYVLKKPLITEKLTQLQAEGKYAFEVDKYASKEDIKRAVKDRYPNVEVGSIHTIIMPSKPKGRFTPSGYVEGRKKVWKKAIVTIKEGEIDFFSEI
ncbi:large subunit ribosomal protein L23 [Fodinibius salinus]|uniref:Large ribosomal subunit protein uL23 n=1 Tax=Fodinibius salinus TaxID=860790 RepID=A0A5D3YIT8_9BACT|nr:50S ribosomal protein L23 [Fodinibius salinus]TYP91451.1 large subunit ribosomal protein L23 [Fodinibius salinus]